MFKLFLSLTTVSLFVLIGINSCSLDNSSKDTNQIEIDKETIDEKPRRVISSDNKENKNIVQNSILDEVESLFEKAHSSINPKNYQKALNIYDDIIKNIGDREDETLLKILSKTYMLKAYISRNYLKQNSKAIEYYDIIIKKLQNSDNDELLTLYYNAQRFKVSLLDTEDSIEIYNEIIDRFKNSQNSKQLNIFATAQFAKSYLLKAEDRIEVYDEIIDEFKDTTNKSFLEKLSKAQFKKANLLRDCFHNKQDAIDVYDEIIEKFKPYENDGFNQKVTDALFFKSYLLMEEDYKQESMELFDEIIDRCQSCEDGEITQGFEFSVINNIELALITNCDDSRYRDLAQEHLSELEDTKPQLEMLSILRNAQNLNQDEAMQIWKEQYKDFQFENWSFEELKKWNNRMEDGEQRERIKGYLDEFVSHNTSFIGEYFIK